MDIIRSIPMNRAQYRALDAKMRRVTRPLACTAGCGAPGTHLLDGLGDAGDAGTRKFSPITSAIGVTLSIPALANANRDDKNPVLMRRVTSLAAVIGLAVTAKPQYEWYETLARITTQKTADDVRRLAAKLNLGVETSFTAALSFAFLQGAVGDAARIDSDATTAYRRALAAFDGAMDLIRASQPAVQAQRLAGLGAINKSVISTGGCGPFYDEDDKIANIRPKFQRVFGRTATDAEIEYYGRMKWCSKPDEKAMDTAMQNIKNANVGTTPGPSQFPGGPSAFDVNFASRSWLSDTAQSISQGADFVANWIKNNIGGALDYVVIALKDLGSKASDLLCTVFRKLFPDPVGGVLCDITRVYIGMVTSGYASLVAILKALFVGLAEFFAGLLKFNSQGANDAAMALVRMVNNIVLILLAGPFSNLLGVPIVDAELTPAQKAAGIESLETISKRLPATFTVSLVAGVLGIIFGGPTPGAISGLIVTLTPAIVAFLAPALKRSPIQKFQQMAVTDIEKGITVIIKIGAMVIAQVMSIKDTIVKFGTALKNYLTRVVNAPGEEVQKLASNFQKEFDGDWKDFTGAIKTCNLDKMAKAAKALVSKFPDVLIAVAKDDPDLKDIYEAGQKIFATAAAVTAQAQAMWEAEFKAAPTDKDKIAVLKKQIEDAKAQVEAARKTLKALCEKKPTDPACKLLEDPVRVETKTVVVEKIVYRDQPAGGSPVVPKPAGKTIITSATASAQKKSSVAPLALATGGFVVGGPIGAVVGLAVGLLAVK